MDLLNSIDVIYSEVLPELEILSKKNAEFISNALKELQKHTIEIIVHRSDSIYKNESCAGSFDPSRKRLEIAIPETLTEYDLYEVVETFAHEYCHFLQFKSKTIKHKISIDTFLNPKNFNKDLSEDLKLIQAMERDCERRVLNLIKKGILQLDYKSYLQNANYYIAYHDIMAITKKWPLNFPDDTDKAFNLLPTNKLIKNIDCLKNKKYEFIIEFIKSVY